MKKDKFIECAKLMMEEHDKYCSIVKDAEKIYLNKLSELDKRYKTKIFTKQTIAEKKHIFRWYETHLSAELYAEDNVIIYSSIVQDFIDEQEEIHKLTIF